MRRIIQIGGLALVLGCCAGCATAGAHTRAQAGPRESARAVTLRFMGKHYVLYRVMTKGIGVSTWYSTSRAQPFTAHDTLMINYTRTHAPRHTAVSAREVAGNMVSTLRKMHAPWVFPFAVAQRHHPGRYTYYIDAWYLLLDEKTTHVMMAVVRRSPHGKWIVGVVYRHAFRGHWSGNTPMNEVMAPAKRWVRRHMKSYGIALARLGVPLPPPVG